jgi:RNA-directed DNA polymerase
VVTELIFLTHPGDDDAQFDALFSAESLFNVFQEKFAANPAKGIDRRSGFQFAGSATAELAVASHKCRDGTFKFSPYLENLKSKGRKSPPRIIGIPTVRDRVVLHQLNRFLAFAFAEAVPKNIASGYVRTVASDLRSADLTATWVCGCDIKTFYDSIQRDRLMKIIKDEVKCERAITLVRRALGTPTIPKDTKRLKYDAYRTMRGVPQGLAISNILASIYLQSVDDAMKNMDVKYYRYVDDVLMYGDEASIKKAQRSLKARLRRRGLGVHPIDKGKSHLAPLSKPFGYLGYHFVAPKISVRDSTVERFLQLIAAKFSDYRHNSKRRLERRKYLTEAQLREIFLLELNERITGAISEHRRYGWIAYYNEITDLPLLHRMDYSIRSMFFRLSGFSDESLSQLKRLSRAYYEMKFSPEAGYVRNYDVIATPAQKAEFLFQRGQIGPEEVLTEAQINDRFEQCKRRALSEMHSDEGSLY